MMGLMPGRKLSLSCSRLLSVTQESSSCLNDHWCVKLILTLWTKERTRWFGTKESVVQVSENQCDSYLSIMQETRSPKSDSLTLSGSARFRGGQVLGGQERGSKEKAS